MNQSVILTVVGSDRPGLTKALADAVYQADGNWLESHLSRLGGQYVGSVLVELPADRLDALEAAAKAIDANGLSVAISPSLAADERSGDMLAIEIVGQDRPGIVREVTTVLAGLHVNIEGFSSEIEGSAWSGSPLFRGRAELLLPSGLTMDRLREALEEISGEIMVDFPAVRRPADRLTQPATFSAAIERSAFSNASGGCPPEMR
jgi:glycine cleavage system regulatory protein